MRTNLLNKFAKEANKSELDRILNKNGKIVKAIQAEEDILFNKSGK